VSKIGALIVVGLAVVMAVVAVLLDGWEMRYPEWPA
jgi:hypothetical protein